MNIRRPTENRNSRLDFDTSMILAATAIAQMSTCTRRAVGCILTKNKHIVSTGYNGSPKGMPHCVDVGCLIGEHGGCIRTVHAEANAVMRCESADTAYCTDEPCLTCLKLMQAKGITRIVHWRSYHENDANDYKQATDTAGMLEQILGERAMLVHNVYRDISFSYWGEEV